MHPSGLWNRFSTLTGLWDDKYVCAAFRCLQQIKPTTHGACAREELRRIQEVSLCLLNCWYNSHEGKKKEAFVRSPRHTDPSEARMKQFRRIITNDASSFRTHFCTKIEKRTAAQRQTFLLYKRMMITGVCVLSLTHTFYRCENKTQRPPIKQNEEAKACRLFGSLYVLTCGNLLLKNVYWNVLTQVWITLEHGGQKNCGRNMQHRVWHLWTQSWLLVTNMTVADIFCSHMYVQIKKLQSLKGIFQNVTLPFAVRVNKQIVTHHPWCRQTLCQLTARGRTPAEWVTVEWEVIFMRREAEGNSPLSPPTSPQLTNQQPGAHKWAGTRRKPAGAMWPKSLIQVKWKV